MQTGLGARRLALPVLRLALCSRGSSPAIQEPSRRGRQEQPDHSLRQVPPENSLNAPNEIQPVCPGLKGLQTCAVQRKQTPYHSGETGPSLPLSGHGLLLLCGSCSILLAYTGTRAFARPAHRVIFKLSFVGRGSYGFAEILARPRFTRLSTQPMPLHLHLCIPGPAAFGDHLLRGQLRGHGQ